MDTIVTNSIMVMLIGLMKVLCKPTGKTLRLTVEYKSKANCSHNAQHMLPRTMAVLHRHCQ